MLAQPAMNPAVSVSKQILLASFIVVTYLAKLLIDSDFVAIAKSIVRFTDSYILEPFSYFDSWWRITGKWVFTYSKANVQT